MSQSDTRNEPGFALIISLVLMSFIFLLVVSLLTLTRVELSTSSHLQMEQRARENSLLGLQVALSELQKATGPDQRVTARADLEYDSAANQPYWTGVYGHALTPDYDLNPVQIFNELTDTAKLSSTGSPAKLLTWLVSGNSTSNLWPTFAPSGQIVSEAPYTDASFRPDAAIANVLPEGADNDTGVTISDTNGVAHPGRVLVGAGSTADINDFVVAPLVEILGGESVGTDSYAWWVGDENVKARANLAITTNGAEMGEAFVNANRTAVELMSSGNAGGALDAPRIGSAYDPYAEVGNAMSVKDLSMVFPGAGSLPETLKNRYHDLSTVSESLLTDAFAGGMKRDLTEILSETYSPAIGDPTADNEFLWEPHPSDTTGYAIPTWRHLRSFAQTLVPASNEVDVRLPSFSATGAVDDVGVAPVLTYFSLGFGASLSGPPAAGVDVNLNLYPMVVLWNPYNFTIKAPPAYPGGGNFEVGMFPSNEALLSVDLKMPGVYNNTSYVWKSVGFINLLKLEDSNGSEKFIRFRLNCPDIPPGQSLIFCIAPGDSGQTYSPDMVLQNIEPEPASYAKVRITSLNGSDLSSPDFDGEFRLSPYLYTASGASLADSISYGEGGQMFAYLGEPVEGPVLMDVSNASTYDPASPDRPWYQTHQDIDWTNSITETMLPTTTYYPEKGYVADESFGGKRDDYSVLQAPKILAQESMPLPSFTYVFQALFSGDGSNAKLDPAQHMFTSKWIAQGNMRAVRSGRTIRDKNFNPLFIAAAGSTLIKTPWMKFQSSDGPNSHRTSAGSGHDWVDEMPVDATLFSFPSEDMPIFSIGQLQHANLSLLGAYPSYPIGNSLADFRLNERSSSGNPQAPAGYELVRADPWNNTKGLRANQLAYYDISYLLNRNLWDQYYFSTVEEADDGSLVPINTRFNVLEPQLLDDPETRASGLSVAGGFNINSTSEEAWRAVLGGNNQLRYNPVTGAMVSSGSEVAFPRFNKPTADNDPDEAWEGYRTLSPEQVAQLARNIVIEIKNRGPFVSVGDFVNRRLVDNPNTANGDTPDGYEQFRGAIQAAIDRTFSSAGGAYPINDGDGDFWEDDELTDETQSTQFTHSSQVGPYDFVRFKGAGEMERPYSNRSAFAPKYVTQADVLSTIGSSLTARSDTFVIRAYGEASVGFGSEVARAWCEAVVRRNPEYVDDTDAPQDAPTTQSNLLLGRKYEVISFRWLTSDEV